MTIKTTNNFEFELGALPLEYLTTAIRRRVQRMLSDISSEGLVDLLNEGMKADGEEEPLSASIIPIFSPEELDTILHACWLAGRHEEDPRMAERLKGIVTKITNTQNPVR